MKDIKVIKSKRKTISLQIKPDSSIELKVPLQTTNSQIQDFLRQKSGWIEKHLQAVKERQKQVSQVKPLTTEE
ncbi:MAG: DUF45 domain-containing protein, partial [Ruminococcus sp.]|nr:DUF45 domain-containing protein [Ruminococcus sp.]